MKSIRLNFLLQYVHETLKTTLTILAEIAIFCHSGRMREKKNVSLVRQIFSILHGIVIITKISRFANINFRVRDFPLSRRGITRIHRTHYPLTSAEPCVLRKSRQSFRREARPRKIPRDAPSRFADISERRLFLPAGPYLSSFYLKKIHWKITCEKSPETFFPISRILVEDVFPFSVATYLNFFFLEKIHRKKYFWQLHKMVNAPRSINSDESCFFYPFVTAY